MFVRFSIRLVDFELVVRLQGLTILQTAWAILSLKYYNMEYGISPTPLPLTEPKNIVCFLILLHLYALFP